jgi:hypothetical protein
VVIQYRRRRRWHIEGKSGFPLLPFSSREREEKIAGGGTRKEKKRETNHFVAYAA